MIHLTAVQFVIVAMSGVMMGIPLGCAIGEIVFKWKE